MRVHYSAAGFSLVSRAHHARPLRFILSCLTQPEEGVEHFGADEAVEAVGAARANFLVAE